MKLDNNRLKYLKSKRSKHMSEAVVREVIGKAVIDPEYRELLFKDPGMVLEGLDLTADEISGLKAIESSAFDVEGSELEARVSRAGISGIKTANNTHETCV
jgi:hypothetical protein